VGILCAAAIAAGSPGPSQEIRTERARFQPGATGPTDQGRITGYEVVDYRLGARAGQTMRVRLDPEGARPYFNLMAPGETETAFFNGSGSVTVFWPEGGNRVLFLEGGAPTALDRTEADGDAEMSVRKEADLFFLRIGDQRFEIPEAVLVGG